MTCRRRPAAAWGFARLRASVTRKWLESDGLVMTSYRVLNKTAGSISLVIIFIVIIVGFAHLHKSFLPNQSLPFISFAKQLQRCLWMPRVANDAQHFSDHAQPFAVIAQHRQV